MTDRAKFTVQLIDKVSGGARSASRSMGTLIARMSTGGKATGAASTQMRVASQRFRDGATSVSSFGGAMSVLKGNLMTMAATKVLEVAKGAALAGAELVTFGQNSRLAFSQLTKHGVEPEKLFEHSRALAKRFGLDVMDTTKQYQKFLALQFDPASADKLIRMGADLRALGNSAEDVQGVFLSLGQIKGKGRLQGEEMLQLAERGISTVLVQEEIGKLMGGKSTQEVQKLQQAGKVTADVGLAAIENAIKRKLGETELGQAGAKFADTTIDGMLGRFKALGQDAGLTAVDKITAPITKLASKGLGAFNDWLTSPRGAETIGKLANGLGRAADFAVQLGEAFGGGFSATWKSIGEGVSVFMGAFAGGDGKTTTALVQNLGRSLGQIAAIGIGVAGALGVVTAGVGLLAGALWKVGVAIVDGFVGTWGTMFGKVISWWDTITSIFNDSSRGLIDKVWSIGKEIVMGLVGGIWQVATAPIDAISRIGTNVAEALRNVLGIHSPSRVTMSMGRQLGAGLAIGTEQSSARVMSASADLGSASLDGIYGPTRPAASFGSGDMGGGGFGGGPITVEMPITVNGGGRDGEEIGREVGRAARREIELFFRQLAMET